MKLDINSVLAKQPKGFLLDLKKHQLAVLNSAKIIEKKFEIGFLKDKAGSGKTSVILALILNDLENKEKTQTVIVVPQNIHTQWISEIKKMCGDSISICSLVNYSDISSLYLNSKILNKDIIITTTLYYETLYSIIQQSNYIIKRTVYDEIDNMKNIMRNKDFKKISYKNNTMFRNQKQGSGKSRMTWYISASMDNIADSKKTINLEGNSLTSNILDKISIECEPEFLIASNEILEDPEITNENCKSDIDIFTDYLSVEQLDALNSMNFKSISGGIPTRTASSEKDMIQILLENYLINIKRISDSIKYKEFFQDKPEQLAIEIKNEKKELDFFKKLVSLFYLQLNLTYNEDEDITITRFAEKISEKKSDSNTKYFVIEKIIKELSKNNKKILIFSDYQGSFDTTKKLLDKYFIPNEELQGGNIESISKSIEKYKNGCTRALLLDSETNSRGMNLENTDVVLFLHKTKEYMYNQIIGRAQRPGRKGKLHIITILNENEII